MWPIDPRASRRLIVRLQTLPTGGAGNSWFVYDNDEANSDPFNGTVHIV